VTKVIFMTVCSGMSITQMCFIKFKGRLWRQTPKLNTTTSDNTLCTAYYLASRIFLSFK